jgi:hypothetical protein
VVGAHHRAEAVCLDVLVSEGGVDVLHGGTGPLRAGAEDGQQYELQEHRAAPEGVLLRGVRQYARESADERQSGEAIRSCHRPDRVADLCGRPGVEARVSVAHSRRTR